MSNQHDDGVIRFLHPDQIAEARERYLNGPLLDSARPVFDEHPKIASLGLWVAQYFADEASDATHLKTCFSVNEDPAFHDRWSGSDPNLAGLPIMNQRELAGFRRPAWSETYWCGPLFASFAPEGAIQDYSSEPETWGRLATVRRSGSQLTVDIEQKQLRPWLDGVAPLVMANNDEIEARREFWMWIDWVCGEPRISGPGAAQPRSRLVDVLIQLADVYDERAEGDWPEYLRNAAKQIEDEGPTPWLLVFFSEASVPIHHWDFPTDPVMLMKPHRPRDEEFPLLEPDDVTRPLLTEIKDLWFQLLKAMPIPVALYRV